MKEISLNRVENIVTNGEIASTADVTVGGTGFFWSPV